MPAPFLKNSSLRQGLGKCILPLVLAVLALGFYLPAVFFPFSPYDDGIFIVLNPLLGPFNIAHLYTIWTIGGIPEENLYIPLTYSSFFVETALFGKKALPIHAGNVALHVLNVLLVYGFAKRLGLRATYAFLAALTFTIHPLQVAPVAWCMGRKDLLSTALALASLSMAAGGTPLGRGPLWRQITIALTGALAMLAKPSLVVLPALLALIEFFREKGELRKRLAVVARPANAALPTVLAVAAIAVIVVNFLGPFRQDSTKTLSERVLCLPVVLGGWCARFAALAPVRHFYRWPRESLLAHAAWIGLLVTAVAVTVYLIVGWRCRSRGPYLFGGLFTLIAFAPAIFHSGLTDKFITADRYGYFPLIGAFIVVGAAAQHLSGAGKKLFLLIVSVWLAVSAVLAWRTLWSWSDDVEFWAFDLVSKPDDPDTNYYLALAYQRSERPKDALIYYARCFKPNHNQQKALYNSGAIYFSFRDYHAAARCFDRAAALDGEYSALAFEGVAEALIKLGQIDDAIKALKKAVEIKPDDGSGRLRLARLLLLKGDGKAALRQARKARALGVEWTDDLKTAFPAAGRKLERRTR